MKVFAVRLHPDQDLKQALTDFANAEHLQAGFLLSAIGSLKQVCLRFANQPTGTQLTGHYEVIALNGTLSVHGVHLHAAIADAHGQTFGGHLDRGCLIYTTAEIVIGEAEHLVFHRQPDAQTGSLELTITPR